MAVNDLLTHREKQLLRLIANGCTTREMAEHLKIKYRTVESHRLNVLNKLPAQNSAHAVAVGFLNGYLLVGDIDSGGEL